MKQMNFVVSHQRKVQVEDKATGRKFWVPEKVVDQSGIGFVDGNKVYIARTFKKTVDGTVVEKTAIDEIELERITPCFDKTRKLQPNTYTGEFTKTFEITKALHPELPSDEYKEASAHTEVTVTYTVWYKII